jgi:hypothetical protein
MNIFKNLLQNQEAKINPLWYILSLGEGNSNFSNKGPGLLQRGDNHKNGVGSFKNLIFKNYEVRKAEFYMKAV